MHSTNNFPAKASFNGRSIHCIAKVKDGQDTRFEKKATATISLQCKFCIVMLKTCQDQD